MAGRYLQALGAFSRLLSRPVVVDRMLAIPGTASAVVNGGNDFLTGAAACTAHFRLEISYLARTSGGSFSIRTKCVGTHWLATDPGSKSDVPSWATISGNELLEATEASGDTPGGLTSG